jgi:hypothetical protein
MCFRTAIISDYNVIRDDEKIVITIDVDFFLDNWFLFFLLLLIEPLESANCLRLFHIGEVSAFPNVFSVVFYM